ncbi:Hsp20/alpha crystallin family protein [candidate division WOR-3 bacterium]|nr:Hsp20/alpha crystallin family protein [candidate division WOR-3 bacterium]
MIKKDLVSYDPLDRFFNIREDFDSVMKDFLRGFSVPVSNRGVFPLADVKEDEDKYTVTVEVPGIEKKDLKIKVKENSLLVEGEKREETKEEGESYLRVERSYGNFRRAFSFASDLDEKKVNAEFKDGILTITLPKTEKEKPQEIEIKVK